MRHFLTLFLCICFLSISSLSTALTSAEIMSPDFRTKEKALGCYVALKLTYYIEENGENILSKCNNELKNILPNVQDKSLLPNTRIQFAKDMMAYSLAGLFIVNYDYKGHHEQTRYGRDFYNYLMLSSAYLGVITSKNKNTQEQIIRDEIMIPAMEYIGEYRIANERIYEYKEGKDIIGSLELEIFPEMNNMVLLKFNDTVTYNADTGNVRTRDWSGICIIKNNILTCENNKNDNEKFSFQAKIDDKSITVINDNGFSNYTCGLGEQKLRSKYKRIK